MDNEKIGASFYELSQDEMDFVTGAKGTVAPQATPAVTTSSFPCINITTSSFFCLGGAVSALSGLVSYTKRCI